MHTRPAARARQAASAGPAASKTRLGSEGSDARTDQIRDRRERVRGEDVADLAQRRLRVRAGLVVADAARPRAPRARRRAAAARARRRGRPAPRRRSRRRRRPGRRSPGPRRPCAGAARTCGSAARPGARAPWRRDRRRRWPARRADRARLRRRAGAQRDPSQRRSSRKLVQVEQEDGAAVAEHREAREHAQPRQQQRQRLHVDLLLSGEPADAQRDALAAHVGEHELHGLARRTGSQPRRARGRAPAPARRRPARRTRRPTPRSPRDRSRRCARPCAIGIATSLAAELDEQHALHGGRDRHAQDARSCRARAGLELDACRRATRASRAPRPCRRRGPRCR